MVFIKGGKGKMLVEVGKGYNRNREGVKIPRDVFEEQQQSKVHEGQRNF